MKSIVFDTGPIISLTMNSLIWVLSPLKTQYGGEFYFAPSVKKELIDRPLQTKKFKFEALHTLEYFRNGTFTEVDDEDVKELTMKILTIANSLFKAKGQNIQIVHYPDIETLAVAITKKSEAIVTDERTLRDLVEKPYRLWKVLERKLHTNVEMDKLKLSELKKIVGDVRVIRSAEIIIVAYRMGILDRYLPESGEKHRDLLHALLWAAKLNGCAISEEEIDNILSFEAKSE